MLEELYEDNREYRDRGISMESAEGGWGGLERGKCAGNIPRIASTERRAPFVAGTI